MIQKQQITNKQAEISFKTVLDAGERMYKIIDIKNVLLKEMLPTEYISERPHFYKYNDVVFLDGEKFSISLKINMLLTYNLLTCIIYQMKNAGSRLTDINKRIAKDRKEWAGHKFTVEI